MEKKYDLYIVRVSGLHKISKGIISYTAHHSNLFGKPTKVRKKLVKMSLSINMTSQKRTKTTNKASPRNDTSLYGSVKPIIQADKEWTSLYGGLQVYKENCCRRKWVGGRTYCTLYIWGRTLTRAKANKSHSLMVAKYYMDDECQWQSVMRKHR